MYCDSCANLTPRRRDIFGRDIPLGISMGIQKLGLNLGDLTAGATPENVRQWLAEVRGTGVPA